MHSLISLNCYFQNSNQNFIIHDIIVHHTHRHITRALSLSLSLSPRVSVCSVAVHAKISLLRIHTFCWRRCLGFKKCAIWPWIVSHAIASYHATQHMTKTLKWMAHVLIEHHWQVNKHTNFSISELKLETMEALFDWHSTVHLKLLLL